MARTRTSALVAAVAVAAAILLGASPAGAATLSPTDWRAEVERLDPDDGTIGLVVVGGDAALELTVEPGHTAVVPGYQDEPYLRVSDDGTVEVNVRSPAKWLNTSATGTGPVPASADAEAPPEWEKVGSDHQVAWHDHRIHAMPGAESLREWTLTLQVDDRPVVVEGTLTPLPSASPLPTVLAALVVGAATLLLGWRQPTVASAVAALGAAAMTTMGAMTAWAATPADLGRDTLPALVPVAAVVLALVAVLTRGRLRLLVTLASLALSAGWVAVNLSIATAAVVPGPLAELVDRLLLGTSTGLVLAAAVLAVWSAGSALAPAPPARS